MDKHEELRFQFGNTDVAKFVSYLMIYSKLIADIVLEACEVAWLIAMYTYLQCLLNRIELELFYQSGRSWTLGSPGLTSTGLPDPCSSRATNHTEPTLCN